MGSTWWSSRRSCGLFGLYFSPIENALAWEEYTNANETHLQLDSSSDSWDEMNFYFFLRLEWKISYFHIHLNVSLELDSYVVLRTNSFFMIKCYNSLWSFTIITYMLKNSIERLNLYYPFFLFVWFFILIDLKWFILRTVNVTEFDFIIRSCKSCWFLNKNFLFVSLGKKQKKLLVIW